jgi:hypothetical protein
MKITGKISYRQNSVRLNSEPAVSRILGAAASLILLVSGQFCAIAQSDDFNDGNDTSPPPPWYHYDPIGGLTAPPAGYLFTNGGYRVYAPVPLAPDAGQARAGSFLTNANYADAFYVSVDVIDFDDTVRQVFGIAARINTPGLGSTGGYLFSWEPGSGSLPGTDNGDLDISFLVNETPVDQIEIGDSHLHLTRGKSYRFVFMGKGFDFEGQVYELPDTTNALIKLPAHDPAGLYAGGVVGILAASQSSLTVPGDATFDNFFAADHDPRGLCDSFNDANDTNPPPPWSHYDPIGGVTADPATYLFTNGGYRIYAPAPAAPDAGPARAGSFLTNSDYFGFYVSADVIDFDDTVRQAFGIAARVNAPGLGTTTGYTFTWEPGSGTLPGTDNGDLDISFLVAETPVDQIETGESHLHLTRGKSYRFVFMGDGTNFLGQVYELSGNPQLLISLPANDPNGLYAGGVVGLLVASQGSVTIPGDATFDNFVVTALEPRLSIEHSGSTVKVSWPVLASYKLQSSPSLSLPVWTDVSSGITQVFGMDVCTISGATDTKFYRLSCSCQ